MYREVTMIEIQEVLRLWLDGVPKKRIARRLGCDPKTVRRYVRAAEAEGATPEAGVQWLTEERLGVVLRRLKVPAQRERGSSWQRCVQHHSWIEQQLQQENVRLAKVQRRLRDRGEAISYRTLHRYAVEELGFGRQAATIPVPTGTPGEELEVDVGWMGQLEPDAQGRRRRFRAWVFTAPYSRLPFVYPAWKEDTDSAIAACEAAWAFYGGVFRLLRPDNTAAIVAEADRLNPRINPKFLEYAQARGLHVDPTRVRSPQDKPRVERMVRHAREDAFAGESIPDLDHARRRAEHWCRHEYGMRVHTSTQRRPLELFEAEEQPALLAPPQRPYDIPVWAEPKVARDQHVQVAKALYSVPRYHRGRSLIGRCLSARADRHTVRLYARHELIKAHPRKPAGARSTDPNDFPTEQAATAQRDVAFFTRQAHDCGPSVGAFAEALLDVPLPWTRMRQVHALRRLARHYGAERLDAACERALAHDMVDLKRLERLLLQAQQPEETAADGASPAGPTTARFLRSPQEFALSPAPGRRQGGACQQHHGSQQREVDDE